MAPRISLALFLTVGLFISAVSMAAKSPIGKWHGKIVANFSALEIPPAAKVSKAAFMKAAKAQIRASKILLIIQPRGRYVQVLSKTGTNQRVKSYGKWTQMGNRLKMHALKSAAGTKDSFLTLASDGNHMSTPIPANPTKISGRIVFSRG